MKLKIHILAEDELRDAFAWYEDREPGLGHTFLDEVDDALASIMSTPLASPVMTARVRRKNLARFPYSVLYHAGTDTLTVLAFMHQRRCPGYWQKRLDDFK